jgi:rare lipoprotein A
MKPATRNIRPTGAARRQSGQRLLTIAGIFGTAALLAACVPALEETAAESDIRPSLYAGLGAAGEPFQTGRASFYRHGARTANGERFDPSGMTAAHRTLPFGTRVRVVEPDSGRDVVVRINDRGPFKGGRVIDLSEGAARAIGMISAGVTEVALYRLD